MRVACDYDLGSSAEHTQMERVASPDITAGIKTIFSKAAIAGICFK